MLGYTYYLQKNTYEESIDAYQQINLKIFMAPHLTRSNPKSKKCCISSATSGTVKFSKLYIKKKESFHSLTQALVS